MRVRTRFEDDYDDDVDYAQELQTERQKLLAILNKYPFTAADLQGNDNVRFSIRSLGNGIRRLTMSAPNPQSEWLLGKALLGTILPNFRGANLLNAFNYRNLPFSYKILRRFRRRLEYLERNPKIPGTNKVRNVGTAQRVKNVRGRPVVQNTVRGTQRPIEIGGSVYKRIFGNMNIQAQNKKQLLGFWNVEYEIDENCFESYFQQNYLKKFKLPKKQKQKLTYRDIFKYGEQYGFNVYVYDIFRNEIDKSELEKPKRKSLHFVLSDEHLYVIKPLPKGKSLSDILIKNEKEIWNYVEPTKGSIEKSNQYKRLVITDEKMFKSIEDKLKEKYILTNYSAHDICLGTCRLVFEADYVKREEVKDQKKSVFTAIDNKYNLTGIMPNEIKSYFNNFQKIRSFQGGYTNGEFTGSNINFDQVRSYPAQLMKQTMKIGIPSINDKFEKYNGKRRLHGWYYVTFKEHDNILYPCDGLYNGYELRLVPHKHVKEIKYQYITEEVREVKITKEDFEKFGKGLIRQYIGWLGKLHSVEDVKSQISTEEELQAFEEKFKIYDTYVSQSRNHFTYTRSFDKIKTGCLARLSIMASCNIQMYEFNKRIMEMNPTAKISQIKTDCIGYVYDDNDFYYPEELLKEKPGCWRIEKEDYETEYEYDECYYHQLDNESYVEPTLFEDKINKIKGDKENINDILTKRMSFQLNGAPGYGKTYNLVNTIIPFLEKNNLKYLVTGSTNKASENLNATTIQIELTSKLSTEELEEKFKDIAYVIIDESSQLTQSVFYILEHLKRNLGTKIILIGDNNQCKAVDNGFTDSWLKSQFVSNLCDNIIVEMPYVENHCRYTKELNTIIEKMKEFEYDEMACVQYLKSKLRTQSGKTPEVQASPDSLHIVRYHKTGIRYTGIDKRSNKKIQKGEFGQEYFTVESIQGTTIDKPYFIHDINMMSWNHMYTAISRAKDVSQITIVI